MDRLQTMAAFIAVSEERGFAAAARRLNVSPPVVTRAVAELEQRLGVKLLNRTTRYVRTTEAGLQYADDARRILEEIELADEAAAGIHAEARGTLVVTAPVMFGRMHVVPGIVDYMNRYPETRVTALFLDRVVNMIEEGIDVGIRIGELPDSSMRALRVGVVRLITVASPAYLKEMGEPQHPTDLNRYSIISSSASDNLITWQFKISKDTQRIRINPRLVVSDTGAAIKAATENFGITRVLSYQVDSLLASGELVRIFRDFEPSASPINIVHQQGRYASPKIRSFIDLIADRLRSNPCMG